MRVEVSAVHSIASVAAEWGPVVVADSRKVEENVCWRCKNLGVERTSRCCME